MRKIAIAIVVLFFVVYCIYLIGGAMVCINGAHHILGPEREALQMLSGLLGQ